MVTPSSGKLCRPKYRTHGVERKLALGRYPAVSLAAARKACDVEKEKASAGDDPAALKRCERVTAKLAAVTTYGAVASEYIAKAKREGRAPTAIAKLK